MPDSLSEHVSWTRNEWLNNSYMSSVINYLKSQNIKSFIDAGGCTGEFTNIIMSAIPDIEISVILEPVKENFDFIKTNVKNKKTLILNKALYQTQDFISLGRIDNNVGGWSINYSDSEPTIECITIEKIVELYNPDFIKIDIEGSERNILENSNKIKSIKYLEIEFHDQYLKPEDWIPYSMKHLPNHRIKFFGDFQCIQNGFFVRSDLY